MSIPTLGYWDIQGLGQPLRMILAYLDIEHEDIVYDNTTLRTTWVTDIKPNLGLDFPNVPYYKDGDLKITQSLAIIRYIGKKHGMYGKSDEESAKIDMLLEFSRDLVFGIGLTAYNPDFVRTYNLIFKIFGFHIFELIGEVERWIHQKS